MEDREMNDVTNAPLFNADSVAASRRAEPLATGRARHSPPTSDSDTGLNDAGLAEAGTNAPSLAESAVGEPTLAEATAAARVVSAPVQSSAQEARLRAQTERLQKWRDTGIRFAFLLLLLVVWQGVHWLMVEKTGRWLPSAFRSPSEVAHWLVDGFGLSYLTREYTPPPGAKMPHSLWGAFLIAPYPSAILSSTWRLIGSYAIALVIGFPTGLLVARFALAEKTVGWLSLSLQSLPSICWVPLAQLWLGRFGDYPIYFVTVLGALFATIVSVADGLSQVPPLLSRAGRTLGADGRRLYFSVLLPAALPAIVSGLKIGWSFAWRSLMAAEIVVYSGGLGQLLQVDRDNNDQEGVIATIIIIIVLGLGVQALVFSPVERRLRSLWGLSGR